uniref:Uncharacterized protein n=1 Tax=Panagrolaimus sp. PS1159 TaxID=55785 RepID=A0AC35FFN1_9BILA
MILEKIKKRLKKQFHVFQKRVKLYQTFNYSNFIFATPPPIDYTTIPGLKAPGLEETEAAITFAPGELIIEKSSTRGCLDQFQHLSVEDFSKSENDPILVKVLNYLNGNYGNISSLFIGPRYVICLSGLKQTKQLRKYWGSNGKIF